MHPFRSTTTVLLALVATTLVPSSTHANPWDSGSMRVSLAVGTGQIGGDSALIVGGGAGYNLLPGFELGLDVDHWFGGSSSLTRVTPGVEYVFWMVPTVQPYLGAFARQWFVPDHDDLTSVGLRAGVHSVASGSLLFGIGVARETFLGGCELGCTDWYPEIGLSMRF